MRSHHDFVTLSSLAQNLLRFEDCWKLIDLDAAVPLGDAITAKSSHKISPPEAFLAALSDNADESGASPSNGAVVSRALVGEPLLAAPTFDAWSVGVVLFELAARQPLFVANGDDSLQQTELTKLVRWSRTQLATELDTLREVLRASDVAPDHQLKLVDILAWCARRASCASSKCDLTAVCWCAGACNPPPTTGLRPCPSSFVTSVSLATESCA